MFIATMFNIVKKWKPKNINGWMGEEIIVYPYNGILLSIKGKELVRHTQYWWISNPYIWVKKKWSEYPVGFHLYEVLNKKN